MAVSRLAADWNNGRVKKRPRPHVPRVVSLGLVFLGAGAAPAWGELAVLTNGQVLKVKSFELRDDRMRLGLPSGGFLTLSIDRIERVLDDEIVEPEPPPEEEPSVPEKNEFSLTFESGDPVPDTPYGELFFDVGRRFEVSPRLLAAVARAESAFDPRAVSKKGARGLLQLMPATAARFGVKAAELFDPGRNVEAGTRYLRFLIAEFEGDLIRVLAAYNAGEGAVRRYGGVPPYRETRGYVRRVLSFLGLAEPSSGG